MGRHSRPEACAGRISTVFAVVVAVVGVLMLLPLSPTAATTSVAGVPAADEPYVARALGVLSLGETGTAYALHRDELLRVAGRLPDEYRARMATYLRSGAIVFAAMEHTKDVIDGAFETPGGSGILTDGEYYWRRDCADYVEHHGVELPPEFIEHVRQLDWAPPDVPPERVLAIDRLLIGRDPS